MKKQYKQLFSNTLLFAISNFGQKILTFLLVPVYTSFFSTAEYGTADIITTTINLLYPILTLSIFEATLRFALDKDSDKVSVLTISLIFTFLANMILLLSTPFVIDKGGLFGENWGYFIGIFFTTCLQACLSNYIKGCNQVVIYAVQGVLYTLVFLGCNIVFLTVFRRGLEGYFISIILAATLNCGYMIIASGCYKTVKEFHIEVGLCKQMLLYSIPLIFSNVAWWINASADKYMILSLVGVGANGLYGIAHKIPTIFSSFSGLFSQAWRISAITSYDENNKKEFYSNIYKVYSLFSIYICFALIMASRSIARLIFKEEFYEAWIFIPPLVVAALFEGYAGFLASFYAAAKKTKFLSISTCAGAFINVIANYILIKKLGAIGAPIATMISFFVVWILRLVVLKKFEPLYTNDIRVTVSLILLVANSIYYSFNGQYNYAVGLIFFVVTVFINLKDSVQLIKQVRYIIKYSLIKKR